MTGREPTTLAEGPPLLLGRYEFRRELGRGAQGRVIEAADRSAAGALRAIKCVTSADEERVRWEFALLARIAHPNLARVYELVRVDQAPARFELPAGSLALVSELAVGVSADRAARLYAADKKQLLALSWLVLERVARALTAIHAQGFVHGDVKPQNVIVSEDLSDAKLIDLGLAHAPGTLRAASGTPGYMAPELWRGELSPAADLFALGMTVWRLLSPERDAHGTTSRAQELLRSLRGPSETDLLPAWVPPALAQLLTSLRAPLVADRPGSARELVVRCGEIAAAVGVTQAPLTAALDEARSAAERALAVTALPWVGHAAALAALRAALETSGVVVVQGPAGAGRSRLIRTVVGALQMERAANGLPLPAYRTVHNVSAQLELPAACVLHVTDGDAADVVEALSLVRSSQLVGQTCNVVLECQASPDAALPCVRLGPLSDLETERLLTQAFPEAAIKAPFVREAMAISGGLAGRLCRVLAAGLAASDDVVRSGKLRAHAASFATQATGIPERARALADLLAVCGGVLPQLAAAERIDPLALAEQARLLTSLGACSRGERGELTLRPDLATGLWTELGIARRAELAKTVPEALLDGRAKAFVACACGESARAAALFVSEIGTLMQRGDPDAAEQLASDARRALGADADNETLRLAHCDALRALGRYGQALAQLSVPGSQVAALARAELLRLSGQSELAADAAMAVRSAEPHAEAGPARAAEVILARLALDAGRTDEALTRAGKAVLRGAVDASTLRAAEVTALAQLQLGREHEAQATAEQALQLARTRADRASEARLFSVLACVHRARGDLRTAGREFGRAFTLAEAAGEYHAAASFLVNVGTAHLDAGELGPALAACRDGARRLARLGRERDLARVLYNYALCAQLIGDYEVALSAARHAQVAALAAQDLSAQVFASVLCAEILSDRGDHSAAVAQVRELPELESLTAIDRRASLARAAVVAIEAGEQALAQRLFLPAEGLAIEDEDDAAAVEEELARAALARARGDLRGASDAAARALVHAKRRGEFGAQVLALLALARSSEALGDALASRRWFAELRSLLDAAALTLLPQERARLREVKAYRAALAALPTVRDAPREHDDRWRRLAALTKRFSGEHRPSRIYEIVLDAAIDLSAAERGYLLWNDSEGVPRVRAGRGLERSDVQADAVSRSIVERVMTSREPLSTIDALADARLSGAVSVHALSLRSVLAVPIRVRGEVAGALYLDDRLRPFAFGDEEVALLADLADLAAIALDSAQRLRNEKRSARRLQIARERLSRRVQAQALELDSWKRAGDRASAYPGIVAHSPAMQDVLKLALRVANADVPVLLRGESGTGKELVAKAIHEQSARKDQAFVSENCAAIPETLLESALFGHVKGAFTGADKRRVGLFEAADGGTLFLDEIGEMSAAMQSRLLRALQDGEIRPVGSERASHVDVRVVAATHRDLLEMVRAGTFREDLYYRLAVVDLVIPPLRERSEDVAPLVAHFLEKHAHGRKVRVDRRALEALCVHAWPGNVRQLENEMRRALALCGDVIRDEHFSFGGAREGRDGLSGSRELSLREQIDALERRLIRRALDTAKGNQTKAAELLGISRFGLQKMQKRLAGRTS